MRAPAPNPVRLTVDRTRCSCATETLVFAPQAWYHGQESRVFTPPCTNCGKPLVPLTVPLGARTEAYALPLAPRSLAAHVDDGKSLVDDINEARAKESLENVAEPPEAPLAVDRWTEPHPAPEAYVSWKAAQPRPEGWIPRGLSREAALTLSIVTLYAAFCIAV